MIPDWKASLQVALKMLRPGKKNYFFFYFIYYLLFLFFIFFYFNIIFIFYFLFFIFYFYFLKVDILLFLILLSILIICHIPTFSGKTLLLVIMFTSTNNTNLTWKKLLNQKCISSVKVDSLTFLS